MQHNLHLYNTLSREKEKFEPLNPPLVGLYVCGPTVYSDVHLGNCRTFISFDMIYRYLIHLGYKVRYVRNITDAGHLEGDLDEGEDKFAKKAKLEQLEPMEIVQKYTLGFRDVMAKFNTIPPNIEPTATGHIIEQIEMAKTIIANGYAYEVNGSVYFDVEKYAKEQDYGVLTNRKLEDLISNSRTLDGQDEKRGSLDFALWINAKPEHIMRWQSPWGEGFPGWHIECSAMSKKYLGEVFDIHGGGLDLAATHHTNEIAQNHGCSHKAPVKYWMHTNMLTVNGARMSKSSGNGFLPGELFTGTHPLLEKAYSPMSVRFFMMQAHYRSTLDFTNKGLQDAEKGFAKILAAIKTLYKLVATTENTVDILIIKNACYSAMDDDFNTPTVIANLFETVRIINSINDGKEKINEANLALLKETIQHFTFDVLGLKDEEENASNNELPNNLMNIILDIRNTAKAEKNFAVADKIRDGLKAANIAVKDSKDGSVWEEIKE